MNDERKTKKELIAELEGLRGENAELRQTADGGEMSAVQRQLAVERVRSEAMAMRGSGDYPKLVGAVMRELQGLGIDTEVCFFNLVDEESEVVNSNQAVISPKTIGVSWTSTDLIEVDAHITVHLEQRPFKNMGSDWFEKWRRGQSWRTAITTSWIEQYQKALAKKMGLARGVWPFTVRDCLIVDVPFDSGTIGVLDGNYVEAHEGIIKEFTQALSLGYLRFLDFQKLEQQAEQARRERAVERVRAEAMAMRSSDDLLKVVAVLYQEINNLGIDTSSASIVLMDRERDYFISYIAMVSPEKHGYAWSSSSWVAYDRETMVKLPQPRLLSEEVEQNEQVRGMLEAWTKGDVQTYTLVIDDAWVDRRHREELGMSDADVASYIGEWRERTAEKGIVNIPFEYGMIGIMQEGRNQRQEAIVKELAQAFSLGYVRYLDFQKVDEAQKNLIDELEEELQTAHTLQMGLMPTEPPLIEGLDITGRCIPANHVGGDFFQYFQQDGKLSVCMADVTGHAMEAAVPVMMFSGILESQMDVAPPLLELFSRMNRTLHKKLDSRTYVCFTMIDLDLANRHLQLANSGCPYPFHYHATTGDVTELQVDAYPLGVRAETAYTAIESSLETGDYIVFRSDGIIEAANANEEMFGFEQTEETIQTACAEGLSSGALIDRLIGKVQEFAGDESQGDDMTCVVLRVEK